jgi:hypothetical protein
LMKIYGFHDPICFLERITNIDFVLFLGSFESFISFPECEFKLEMTWYDREV